MTTRFLPRALSAVLILSGCAPHEAGPPLFALEQCAPVTLVDETSGSAVTGAEDLDIDAKGRRIFISAYDRRKAETAAAKHASSVPEGGVYAIDLEALKQGQTSFSVQPLLDPRAIDGGLRPHGVSYDRESGVVSFVNRAYFREGQGWRRQSGVISVDPERSQMIAAADAECSANDLTSHDGAMLVTLDRSGCGWRAGADDVLGTRAGRVVDARGNVLLSGIGFANGAVTGPDGELVVAATRERKIYVIDVSEGRAKVASTIKVRGAPDNLTLSDEGRIVAAVHPSLLSIGMQRIAGLGRSPSRVIDIDLKTGGQRILFDDPKAALIAAATAAVLSDDLLVIGSVIDSGLVVCRGGAAPR